MTGIGSPESHFAKTRARESLHNESYITKRHCQLEIVSINPKLENRFVECGIILQSCLHNRVVSEPFQDVSRPETSLKSVSDFNCSDRNNLKTETSQSCQLPVFLHNICTQHMTRNHCRIQMYDLFLAKAQQDELLQPRVLLPVVAREAVILYADDFVITEHHTPPSRSASILDISNSSTSFRSSNDDGEEKE